MRIIRLFPDVGSPSVLWEAAGPESNPPPSDLGLSPRLTEELDAWHQLWRDHADPFTGWDTPENETLFLTAGMLLRDAVQSELGPQFDVLR